MIPNHKGEIPVALLLLPFVLGILMGLNFSSGFNINLLYWVFAVCSIIFILLNLKYSGFKLYKKRWIGGGLMAAIVFIFGWILPLRYNESGAGNHFSKFPAQYLVVKIGSEPVLKNGLFRFTSDVEETINNGNKTITSGTLLISIKDSLAAKLHYGDELLVPAKYAAIDPPFNPAEFNYKSYLARKNIFYESFLYPKQYTVLKTGSGNPLIEHSALLRRQLVEKLRQNIRDTDAYAVASALVLGYRADLSSDILEAYSKTGTLYVLTVSGAQVAIIYFILTYGLRFLDRFKYGKGIKTVIIIAILWYYALLTGFSIAVCRAALMLSMVIIGKTSRRYVSTLNILAASAFILLCFDPFFIAEPGFQLSYLAVFAVIILRPVVYGWFSFKNKLIDKVWSVLSFSIAIQLAIFPLCALYFHQFPVYFLVSNLFVVLPAAIIMYAGVFFLLLPKIPLVSLALAFVLEKTTVFMNKVLAFIEHLPGASFNKIWLTPVEYLLFYAIIISLFYYWYNKKVRWLKIGLSSCLLLFLSFSIKNIRQSTTKNIAWLNLKKHPAIVFKNGNSGIVLTDLKETDKAYKYSIQPYLDSCRVERVKTCDLNTDISSPWFKKSAGLVQFINTKVFICDQNFNEHMLAQNLKADFIYVTGNPGMTVTGLDTNFSYHTLVIDGSNSDNRVAEWEKQLSGKSIDYKILKRNKSFVSISN
jgi:competence protein ComEC